MSSDWHKSIQALLDFPVQMSNMFEIMVVSDSQQWVPLKTSSPSIIRRGRDFYMAHASGLLSWPHFSGRNII